MRKFSSGIFVPNCHFTAVDYRSEREIVRHLSDFSRSFFKYMCEKFPLSYRVLRHVSVSIFTVILLFRKCFIVNCQNNVQRKPFVQKFLNMESQNPSQDNIEHVPENTAPISSEDFLAAEQNTCKRERRPKRILQFSDGEMVEYSSEDEADAPKKQAQISTVDPKSLNWGPWAWYQTTWVGTKLLNGCDYVGEALADFLGITSPKYQFEIDEYHRMHAAEAERAHRQDLEMGGWNENHQNNVIADDKVTN